MIIDCHVHLNRYHEDDKHPSAEHLQHLLREMDAGGVEHAVVLTSYTTNCDRPGVQEVLSVVHGSKRATIVEGLRWRSDNRTDLFQLEERIKAGVVRGVKLYPGYDLYAINDASLESVFRLAGRHDVPVMIHTGDTYAKHAKVRHAHPLLVDDIAVDFPDVKFVMCHAGNPWFVDAAEVLYKNDNVYADISGLTLGQFTRGFERLMLKRLEDMIEYLGDTGRQLMYGSDWPLVEMSSYLAFLDRLPLNPEHRECVAWRTAARLFRIDVEESRQAALRSPHFVPRPPA